MIKLSSRASLERAFVSLAESAAANFKYNQIKV